VLDGTTTAIGFAVLKRVFLIELRANKGAVPITVFRIQDERFLWADHYRLLSETIALGQIYVYNFRGMMSWRGRVIATN
jgi:hypothetical protein